MKIGLGAQQQLVRLQDSQPVAVGKRVHASRNVNFTRRSLVKTFGTLPSSATQSAKAYFDLGSSTPSPPNGSNGSNEVPTGPSNSGALAKADYGKFVQFFRQASPYIEGHRGRTFVIVVPGDVSNSSSLLT